MTAFAAKQNFWEQRYRGWLWFDERAQEEQESTQDTALNLVKLQQQAKAENEAFSQELELLRHLMIRHPENIEYVLMYKQKEQEMWERGSQVAQSWLMANFLNPDLVDELKYPQNLYGRAVKKQVEQEENRRKLQLLANKVDLFIFRQDDCVECPILERHLHFFAGKFAFTVEAISNDASSSEYFTTHHAPEMIKALQLNVLPSVIAVVKDTRARFELARGAVSVADLEDKALMLFAHLQLKLPSLRQGKTPEDTIFPINHQAAELGGCSTCELSH